MKQPTFLRAGLVGATPGALCPHCSRPVTAAGRCACGLGPDPRRPHHGLAEVLLGRAGLFG